MYHLTESPVNAAGGLSEAPCGIHGGAREVVSHRLAYRPALMGAGEIHFIDRRRKVDGEKAFGLLAPPPSVSARPDWEKARRVDASPVTLDDGPGEGASFEALPESINEAREFNALEKGLRDHLYRSSAIELRYSRMMKMCSLPGESERDFGLRLQQGIREKRDREVDKLERRFSGRLRRLADKVQKQAEAVARSRKSEVLVSLGESLVGAFLGRRSLRGASTTLSKYR